jgi:hypothetical protein
MKLAPAHAHLSSFMSPLKLVGVPLVDSTQMVLKQLKEFEQSDEIRARVGKHINELTEKRREWSDEFVSNGKKFIKSLGGNGASVAADKIAQILVSNGFN